MAYPGAERIELPILYELIAVGGVDEVRYLYERLVAYFPQLTKEETRAPNHGHSHKTHHANWRSLVQRAGRALDEKRAIERQRGRWTITATGRKLAGEQDSQFSLTGAAVHPALNNLRAASFSHKDVQMMLLDIGRALGYRTESEFEYYDVVWRENETSPRLSHVFEVQNKGNIDAALAKLKRAYDAQRSKPYLVVSSERDTNRAEKGLSPARTGAFHEIGKVTQILSFEQVGKLHRALTSVEELLAEILE